MEHPKVAHISCRKCQKWWYDENWDVYMRSTGRGEKKPVPRPNYVPTPCHKCPKVPEGVAKVAENAVEISDKNWEAYQHYRECEASASWPDDLIVRQNAALIRAVDLEVRENKSMDRLALTVLSALVRAQ